MEQADKNIPPPIRPQICEKLRRLRKGESWLFENPPSVQALVTRITKEFDGKRKFTTEKQSDGNVRVWRLL